MNDLIYPKGSEWRKWDLHIHTPYTKLNNQYEIDDNVWKKFSKKIEESDVSVFGITDYFSLDNYFIFISEFRKFYPNSNKVFFPNIEFRIDSKNSNNEHIQIHVIFSNNIEETKLNEFLIRLPLVSTDDTTLTNKFCTSGDLTEVTYEKAMITVEGLKKQLENNFPPDQYLIIGVANGYGSLRPGIDDGRGAEYAKELDKICNAFYGNKGNVDFYLNKTGERSNFNLPPKPVLLGSDCHSFNDIEQKLSKQFTWIKADPTFEGLKQILYEPEERVFIGEEPELLKRVKENKTKFIKSIRITQNNEYNEDKGVWFKNIEIPLNPGLVSIIGNKGSGKSALVDIISLCGNSHRYADFSFLREGRFLKEDLASNFNATLEWEDGSSIQKKLNEGIDINSPERVRYLPQNFFEKLANSIETNDFEETLEKIVFSCIPEEQKLGKNTFAELIKYKKESIERDITKIKNDIKVLNEKIIEKEKKLHPDYKEQKVKKLELRKKELEELKKIKPKKVQDPSKDQNLTDQQKLLIEKQKQLNNAIDTIQKEITYFQERIKKLNIGIAELQKIKSELIEFKTQLDNYINNNRDKFTKYGLQIEEIISYKIDIKAIDKKYEEYQSQINTSNNKLNEKNLKYEEVKKELEEIKNQLSEPQKKYQKYIEELKEWEKKKNEIEGDENKIDAIKFLEKEINYIEKFAKSELNKLREERLEKSIQIFNKKKEIIDIYEKLKNAVAEEIGSFKERLGDYQINIETSLKLKPEFYDVFFRLINQRVRGSFYGISEGKTLLKKLVETKNFNNDADIKSFLKDIIESLENDKRDGYNNEKRYIKDQILREDQWLSFYEYLFSLDYLDISYELKLGNKHITQLSPGERGALLIIFYLLLDKDDIPLIIDQPEENLDNESIFKVLTYFIRYTKKKRQLIIVTHNPNLAIVGDAEQLIYVNIDKNAKNTFCFDSGSIENPTTNKHASDILEGTLKAFDIRRLKYLKV